MSSFGIGLGSSKKGGRVADSSMLTANIKIVAQGQSDATHADNQKRQFKLSSAILNGGAYNSATLAKQNLGVSRAITCLSPFNAFASYVPSQWSINGNASNTGTDIQIVPNATNKAGSAYYRTAIDISRPFTIRATVVLGDHSTVPADGFAIALIDASSSANATYVGAGATGVGFISGSPPSWNGIATRIQTYNNNKADIVDIAGNLIGSQPNINAGLIARFTAPDSFYVTLTYQNGALTWTLANVSNTATQTFGPTTIDLVSVIGGSYAFIGASAGSGGSTQKVSLTGLTYEPLSNVC